METFLQHLALQQAAQGHEVLVLAHARGNASSAVPGAAPGMERPTPGLTVVRVGAPWLVGGYAPLAPAMPLAHLRALVSFRPQVLHVHAPNGAALWPALMRGGAALVLHWHADVEFPPDRGPSPLLLSCWRGLESFVLGRSHAVIATSRAYLEASPALAPYRAKCHVAPLGLAEPVAPTGCVPAGRSGEGGGAGEAALLFLDAAPGLRVVAVGRLAHYKGFRHLLQALLHAPEASLCLVGGGEQRPALEDFIAARPELAGRVLLAGELGDAALDACLRRAHVLCLPSLSRSEAFGMVLLEAMARGLPCVASDVPGSGMAEVLGQGRAGMLVPPGDAQTLALALQRLAQGGPLRQGLGLAGLERFGACYEISAVARRIDEVYELALGARDLPTRR